MGKKGQKKNNKQKKKKNSTNAPQYKFIQLLS